MNEIKQFKQIKEFSTGNKVRDIISKELEPTVLKVQEQANRVREQMDSFKHKYGLVIKLEHDKEILEKNIKDTNKQVYELRQKMVGLKNDIDIGQAKNEASMSTLSTTLGTFERTLLRRQQTLKLYDKKFSDMMENIAKHQAFVGDRFTIFEEKFKKLIKDTYELTKDVKRDFDNSMSHNEAMKNELMLKLKQAENRQKMLDVFVVEREENCRKIIEMEQKFKLCVQSKELEQYKKVQNVYMQQNYQKINSLINNVIPLQTQNNLKIMNIKFAQIQQLKLKCNKIEEIKTQIKSINQSIMSIQAHGDEEISKLRVQTDEMEEKIIDVIDKKFQTIEEHIQQKGTQTQDTFQQKLNKMRKELQEMFMEKIDFQSKIINQLDLRSSTLQNQKKKDEISEDEKEKFRAQAQKIKQFSDGLQDKLNLFANRIVVCRSDMQIFAQNTRKELKKINAIKLEQANHIQNVGKILSQMMESMMMITALTINSDKSRQNNKYVTYQDGIVFQVDDKRSEKDIIYRRKAFNPCQLKESLLYCLVSSTDDIIANYREFRWDQNQPSEFFKLVKSNFEQREKSTARNRTLPIYSSKKHIKIDEDQTINELRRNFQSPRQEPLASHLSKFTINESSSIMSAGRPTSEVQKRYKIKKPDESTSKKLEQRERTFTASRSHRKTKLSYI